MNRRARQTKTPKTLRIGTIQRPLFTREIAPVLQGQNNLDPDFPNVNRDNQVFNLVQSYEILTAHQTSTSISTFSAFSFTVNNLDQVSALSSVFDQYRICMVEFLLYPALLNTAVLNEGLMTSVIDYDDAANLTSVASALDYTNALTYPGGVTHRRCFVPHSAAAAYSGAFTSYQNNVKAWIDFGSPSVQHYGIKFASTVTSSVVTYNAVVRLWIQCKNVR